MLGLFNLKEKSFTNNTTIKKTTNKTSKYFPSPLREWNNSIYVYNKNSVNKLPSTTNTVNTIIKNYFNFYNRRLELKMRSKRLIMRLRKLSSNRFFVSSGAFKHTNNKVCINLYVFNKQKINYLLTLKRWFLKTLLSKSLKTNSSINLIKRVNIINKKGIENLISFNQQKYLLVKTLNTIRNNENYDVNSFNDIVTRTEDFYKKLIKKSLKKIRMYFYYKQLIYLNKSKLNYTYLQYLSKYIEKMYNKNVEFNIFNVKRFYLNSDILSESLALKVAKNRRNTARYLNVLNNKINTRKKKVYQGYLSNILNNFALPLKSNLSNNNNLLQNYIIDNLKYKHLTGFRLEIKGKVASRSSASRTVSRLIYKGNLLDIDSSYKGLSSVLLKGNLRSNTQYTNIRSKSRIGSFGIKGWISGN